MLSSLTHEIVTMYSIPDPVAFFESKHKENLLSSLLNDKSTDVVQFDYVHRKGEEFRHNMNYAWLLSCGFIPFREFMRFSDLPTIVDSNKMDYIFDDAIRACTHDKHDVLYDSFLDHTCPVCFGKHKEQKLNRLKDLWDDFPIYKSLTEVLETGLIQTLLECQKLKYPKTRLGVSENHPE